MFYEHEFIDFIPVPVFICDKTTILDRNKACDNIINEDFTQVEECLKIFKEDDYNKIIKKLNETLISGKSELIEHAKMDVEGRIYDVSIHFDNVIRDNKNRVIVTLKDTEDTLPLNQNDNVKHKLINQEKMAGIGHLAAGVAHEIFNPLGYIKSNFDTLNQYFSDVSEVANEFKKMTANQGDIEVVQDMRVLYKSRDIDFILSDIQDLFTDVDEGLQRVLSIVNGLKRFAHDSDDIIEYDLNEGIKSTLMISKNEFKYDAVLEVQYGDISLVNAHSGKINQVVLGMIVNAVYAIKEKHQGNMGLLRINTFMEKNLVCCTICDDGVGISKEKLNEVYNPFYTTKPEGVGTGLGLSIAWDIIVEQHSGELEVVSELGKGTCFTIKLPVAE